MTGKTHSPEARAKMAAAKRGNQNRLGKTHSEETRRKISESKTGVSVPWSEERKEAFQAVFTPEWRAEASNRLRGMRYGKPAAGVRKRQGRYIVICGQWSHPLAHNGVVSEHRKVLYDAIGPGPHPCHWGCGKILEWGGRQGVIVDHLDGDIHNNDLANLVPSCNMCNIHRRAV